MNTAAKKLSDAWVRPHYQVILDSHAMMENEIGEAEIHLLASIVNPKLFEYADHPVMWHPLIDWIEEEIPVDYPSFHYIGGGVTVTNSAICIAYTMGYREIHIFGMDSSFSAGRTHSTEQQTDDVGLRIWVDHNGKTYETSFGLKQQVLVFLELKKQLEDAGCKVIVHGSGLLPDVVNGLS
jgi:hypothetical protein